jgi:hypothetical protein
LCTMGIHAATPPAHHQRVVEIKVWSKLREGPVVFGAASIEQFCAAFVVASGLLLVVVRGRGARA